MRLKSAVLGLVAACGAVLVIPSPVLAAAQCSLILPAKVVVDSATERIPMRLSSDCASNGAASAAWDVRHGTVGWRVAVDAADFASGNTRGELVYKDTAPRGLYRGNRLGAERADNQPLVQNIPTMLVKNACRVSITGHRSSMGTFTQYTIDVKGSIWSSASHSFVTRRGGEVTLLKKRADGTWAYDRTSFLSRTTDPGTSWFWPKGAKKGDQYRVVVRETDTAWTCGSSVHTVTT
jgi:hypothetical protein